MSLSSSSRPTSSATQLSLTRLAGGLTAVGLLWLAAWIVLAPPEDVPGPWLWFGVLSAALAIPAAACWLWPRVPGARWTPLVAATIALGALVAVNLASRLIGWWPAMELAALLALAATVALPTLAGALAQAAILALSAAVILRGASPFTMVAGPAAIVSAGARLLVAAGTVTIGNALLRRASAATDSLLAEESRQREVLAVEERRRRSDRAARRFLHDSGMNSLEAVGRGVPAGSVQALRDRCAIDAERWLRSAAGPADDAVAAFEPALQEAALRGLQVDTHFAVDGQLPAEILHALAQATGEALRNTAKHAQIAVATVDVQVGQGSATVLVTDAGRGFDPTAPTTGLGVADSIRRRMVDAGGDADIDSAPGRGTSVRLRWPVATLAGPPSVGATLALDLPHVLARLALLPVAAVAIGAVASAVVNWWSVQFPWLLGASGLLLAGACGWFVQRWRWRLLDRFDVALLTCALVLSTLILPVADPFCSAASGPPLIPDGRLVALSLVGVLLASWRVSFAVLACTLGALAVAGAMWHSLWPMCAPEAIPTAIGMTVVTMIGLVFGRAVRSQEAAARDAFTAMEDTNLELARRRADELVRAEWGITAVAYVRDLLRMIADPATDLADPTLRKAAGDAACRLRAVVRASELPGPLATVVSQLVELGGTNDFRVTVEGDLANHDANTLVDGAGGGDADDDSALRQVADALGRWVEHGSTEATSAVVTLSEFDGECSVLVWLASTSTQCADSAEHDESDGAAPEAAAIHSWRDGTGAWWQAEWRRRPGLIMSYSEHGQSG